MHRTRSIWRTPSSSDGWMCSAKRYGQYYVHDVYRFLYASRLHTLNQPLLPWLADEEVKQDAVS